VAVGGRLAWDSAWEQQILQASGLHRILGRAGEITTQGAKRRAAVSPDGSHGRPSGYMRSHIGWALGEDSHGPYVDVAATATTPEGHTYPLDVELGTKPHLIVAHGPYPLRDKHGRVFGRVVHHPGTQAQPFLRPALDDLAGQQL
jgi:hypothetical protein